MCPVFSCNCRNFASKLHLIRSARFLGITLLFLSFVVFKLCGQASALSIPQAADTPIMKGRVCPQMFGAVGDGKSDDTAAFLSMTAFCNQNPGTCVDIPSGHYVLLKPLVFTENVVIRGDGTNTLLDFSRIADSRDAAITITGRYQELEGLKTPHKAGESTFQYHMSSLLSTGDIIAVLDPRDYSWNRERSYFRKGEFCEILASGRTSAELVDPLNDDYGMGCRLLLMDMVQCEITGICIRVLDRGGIINMVPLRLCNARNSLVRDVKAEGSNNAQIEIKSSRNVLLDHICADYICAENSGNSYGVMIANSEFIHVTNSTLRALRHGMAIGGGAEGACVINRHITVNNSTISSYITTGADIHGNSQFVAYQACEIFNGIDFAGSDITVNNCNFYTSTRKLWAVSFNLADGTATIKGNHFYIPEYDRSNLSDYLFSVELPKAENSIAHGIICIENNIFEGCGDHALQINAAGRENRLKLVMKDNVVNGGVSIENIYESIFEGNSITASCHFRDAGNAACNSTNAIHIHNNVFSGIIQNNIQICVPHSPGAVAVIRGNTFPGTADQAVNIEKADQTTVIEKDNVFLAGSNELGLE